MGEVVKKDYVVVSFSGGKDSTAMRLHMIEMEERIDGHRADQEKILADLRALSHHLRGIE